MAIGSSGFLRVFLLNAGQADTSVIVLPSGKVIVIDAAKPAKLMDLLGNLGMRPGDLLDHLVITHPHYDHCSAANKLAETFRIGAATLSPFWNPCGMGSPTYQRFVARLQAGNVHCSFVSGYGRWYPDGSMERVSSAPLSTASPFFEFLGPTNNMMVMLDRSEQLNTNHLTVMARLSWHKFRMVFAGDAQMENWAVFDSEDMLKDNCTALKAAHHGSGNGTQWERINRLNPHYVLVPANPSNKRQLPDVVGTAVFARYSRPEHVVSIMEQTGSVRLTIKPSGEVTAERFDDRQEDPVDLSHPITLDWQSNPTDWQTLLRDRAVNLHR